jgi:hypothetical protein
MVSAGVCHGGKGRLHFINEKAKINTAYYICKLQTLINHKTVFFRITI